jgi:hypothetical protein
MYGSSTFSVRRSFPVCMQKVSRLMIRARAHCRCFTILAIVSSDIPFGNLRCKKVSAFFGFTYRIIHSPF